MEELRRASHGDARRHQTRHEPQVVLVHHIGAPDLTQDAVGPERHAEASIAHARQAHDADVGKDTNESLRARYGVLKLQTVRRLSWRIVRRVSIALVASS